MKVEGLKIVSGGQTGADRAALDWAISRGVPHGGWCPKERRAEDGVIASRYKLKETPGSNYTQRTEWNVTDSDGTVIFTLGSKMIGGSSKTAEFAQAHGRPYLHISGTTNGEAAEIRLGQFLSEHNILVLNVAGSRASEEPGIAAFVTETLDKGFGEE